MHDDSDARQLPPAGGTELRAAVAEFERTIQENAAPLLEKAKQALLNAIDEAVRKHGVALVAELRGTLKAAVDGIVAAQIEKMVEQLRPNGDAARRLAEGWFLELRGFADTTVRDLFETRVPEYSRWAGQRVLDFALVGVLFVIAAVLLFAGGILGLREAGVPPYAALLIGGVVALGFGFWLLRTRPRPEAPGERKPPGG
ncbi:MAG TPA: hypothetical protein VM529_09530 [Gemmata sp.]|nr:hypothetical protein [Gemmata sp.]